MAWEADFLRNFSLMRGDVAAPAMLDKLERTFWIDFWRSPVVDAVEEDGIEARRYGPVYALVVAGLPRTPLLNMVLGVAEPGAVEEGHLEEALKWVESLGVDFRIPITPGLAEAGAAEDLLNQHGCRRGECLVRFVREPGPPDFPEPPGIEVMEVDEFTEGFGDFPGRGFELHPAADSFFDCLPGRESWRSYLALDEHGSPVASASTMLHFEVAQIVFAATQESARGKGAHLALLRRRILDASASHCHTLFAETRESLDDPDGPSPGARNLVRAGFKQVAVRPVWRPAHVEPPQDDALGWS